MGRLRTHALRISLLAAALLGIGAHGSAQELHVSPATPSGQYFWSETEKRFGLGIEAPADSPTAEEPAVVSALSPRCVLVQCVKISGGPEAPPTKLFAAPVTLWTAAGLLVGIADGALGPIRDGIHGFHFTDEGFFQYTTYGGGSDKASHFVISANATDLLYDAYRLNRLTPDQAFWLSFVTVTLGGAFVEVGDGLTPYGFSAQDL